MSSDTPRTDNKPNEISIYDFARVLERENAALLKDAERWRYGSTCKDGFPQKSIQIPGLWFNGRGELKFYPTAEEAIDAAMGDMSGTSK